MSCDDRSADAAAAAAAAAAVRSDDPVSAPASVRPPPPLASHQQPQQQQHHQQHPHSQRYQQNTHPQQFGVRQQQHAPHPHNAPPYDYSQGVGMLAANVRTSNSAIPYNVAPRPPHQPQPHEMPGEIPAQSDHSLYNVHLHQLQQLHDQRQQPMSAQHQQQLALQTAQNTAAQGIHPAHTAQLSMHGRMAMAQQQPASAPAASIDPLALHRQLEPFGQQPPDIHSHHSQQPPSAQFRAFPTHVEGAPQRHVGQRPADEFLLMQHNQQTELQFQQLQNTQKQAQMPPRQKDNVNAPQQSSNVRHSRDQEPSAYRGQMIGDIAPHSQLFGQQQGFPHAVQQVPDRTLSANLQQQPRGLQQLQPAGVDPAYSQSAQFAPDSHLRKPQMHLADNAARFQQQQQTQLQQNNYMMQQPQQQMHMPDEFASSQVRNSDPRTAGIGAFGTSLQQFNLQAYPGGPQGPGIDHFNVMGGPVPHSTDQSQQQSNIGIPQSAGMHGRRMGSTPLQNTSSQGFVNGKPEGAAVMPADPTISTVPGDAQLLASPQPRGEVLDIPNIPGSEADTTGATITKGRSKKRGQTTQVKKDNVTSSVPSATSPGTGGAQSQGDPAQTALVGEGATNAADIDGSLIARLRGFSHVNPRHPKQPLMGHPQAQVGSPRMFSGLEGAPIVPGQNASGEGYRPGPGSQRDQQGNVRQIGDVGSFPAHRSGQATLPGPSQIPVSLDASSTPLPAESSSERPFQCKFCPASFGRRDNMQKHMRSIHMGERPFKCEICLYAFQKKDHKDKHVRTVHMKERPYSCTACESRFGQKSDLTKHIRTVHERIKPYSCEHCGLSFGHRGNKLRHVFVVHEKRKPHVCKICNQPFGERSNLAKHSIAVHKQPPPK